MSVRPYDWQPLAASDPIPGDPDIVEDGGTAYQATARAMTLAAEEISSVMTDTDGESGAVAALRERLAEIEETIDDASSRYQKAGDALVAYAESLRSAQKTSITALESAQAAQSTARSCRDNGNYYLRLADRYTELGDASSATRCNDLAHTAFGDANGADGSLDDARTQLAGAISERDEAARTLRGALDTAMDDGLNDGWWENWGSDWAHAISDIAGTIAAWAGVGALVLAWVPGLGQLLGAVALIAGAVALVADIALLAHGEGSWGDVIWGAVGVLTFGVGRVAAPLLKTVASSARAGRGTRLVSRIRFKSTGLKVNTAKISTTLTRTSRSAPIKQRLAAGWNEARRELGPRALWRDAKQGWDEVAKLGKADTWSNAWRNATRGSTDDIVARLRDSVVDEVRPDLDPLRGLSNDSIGRLRDLSQYGRGNVNLNVAVKTEAGTALAAGVPLVGSIATVSATGNDVIGLATDGITGVYEWATGDGHDETAAERLNLTP
ncbi:DUF308 domain-containing protein [Demequina sp. NBRC 110051]|uniref:DUF308 domain-containing protein n=1 Tax=Demequina sp. NBRC 110051 TaxID=1570340 RepID=UPI0009FFFAB0|nr:DUF308 domain-containing protein [Demequina sp. NBRC 110051]